jgi:hypothetical protein
VSVNISILAIESKGSNLRPLYVRENPLGGAECEERTIISILATESIGSNHRLLLVRRELALQNGLREENDQYGITGELLLLPHTTSTRQMGIPLSGEE